MLITGASRGIGAAIAERFAKEGARCVLVGRNEEKLREVRERLRLLGGEEHVVRAGDVGSVEFWNEVARKEVNHPLYPFDSLNAWCFEGVGMHGMDECADR